MNKMVPGLICLLMFFIAPVWSQETDTDYFAVYLNGVRCGYSTQTRQVTGNQVTNTEKTFLDLKRMGTPLKVTTTESMTETLTGKPVGFSVEQDMSVMKSSIKGTIGPDNMIEVVSNNAGDITRTKILYPEGALFTEGLDLLNRRYGLKEGTSYSARAFSPGIMKELEITFNVGPTEQMDLLGRVLQLTEIKGEYILPGSVKMSYTAYVDQDFQAQKMISPMAGMDIEKVACAEEFALSGVEAAEMVSSMLIKSPLAIENPGGIKAIEYILKPVGPDKEINIPHTNNQSVIRLPDNTIRLTVRPVKGDPEALFPYRSNDPEIRKELEGSTYLQADHPEIIALAEKAVSGKKTSLEAAMAIEAFVAGYIETKDLSVGYASALEVAKSRQGDCTEHAVLTAALCRAAGIPARVVMGIVYVDEFQGMKNIFGGHAWVEACIGNKWVGLDAAFRGEGRGGFDAGHISLASGNGEPADFFGLAGSLGMFTIEGIKIER